MGFRHVETLPQLKVSQLRELAKIARAYRGKREKGGIYRKLRKDELMREIRRSLASTFPDTTERANKYVESILNEGVEEDTEYTELDLRRDVMNLLTREEPKSVEDIERTRHKYFEAYKFKGTYVVKHDEDGLYYPVSGKPDTYELSRYSEHAFDNLFDAMVWNVRRQNENLKSTNIEIF